jgi:hypothetical protein
VILRSATASGTRAGVVWSEYAPTESSVYVQAFDADLEKLGTSQLIARVAGPRYLGWPVMALSLASQGVAWLAGGDAAHETAHFVELDFLGNKRCELDLGAALGGAYFWPAAMLTRRGGYYLLGASDGRGSPMHLLDIQVDGTECSVKDSVAISTGSGTDHAGLARTTSRTMVAVWEDDEVPSNIWWRAITPPCVSDER